MGVKRLESLVDFHQHHFDVKATCAVCGHSTVFNVGALSSWIGGRSTTIRDVEKHMRCMKCGQRRAKITAIDWCLSRGSRRGVQ